MVVRCFFIRDEFFVVRPYWFVRWWADTFFICVYSVGDKPNFCGVLWIHKRRIIYIMYSLVLLRSPSIYIISIIWGLGLHSLGCFCGCFSLGRNLELCSCVVVGGLRGRFLA